jgi:hypothetical protein
MRCSLRLVLSLGAAQELVAAETALADAVSQELSARKAVDRIVF